MTRQILFLLIITISASCNTARQKIKEGQDISGSNDLTLKDNEKIRFDFTAVRINTFQETIEINASLYNDNADTIYFLSSSCDG